MRLITILFSLGVLHPLGSLNIETCSISNPPVKNCTCKCNVNESIVLTRLPDVIQNFTKVRFCFIRETLDERLLFSGLKNISLIGYGATIECSSSTNAGFEFHRMENLLLLNFSLVHCSFSSNITKQNIASVYQVSMLFNRSYNINITQVNIAKSRGKGLALYDCNGVITISNGTFKDNGHGIEGGNGVFIDNLYQNNNESCSRRGNKYILTNCSFFNNSAVSSASTLKYRFLHFGRGGGLGIYLSKYACDINILISNCKFIGNFATRAGGGLMISNHGATSNNFVHVCDSKFIENESSTYGGGAFLGYVSNHGRNPVNCSYFFDNCSFIGNSAQYGGGSSLQSFRNTINSSLTHYNCSWIRNSALFGSAMSILPNTLEIYTEGSLPSPVFENCTFDSNTIRKDETYINNSSFKQQSQGIGAIYCSSHNILIKGVIYFLHNEYTGVYLTACRLISSPGSVTTFDSNVGLAGAAIHLLGNSIIYAAVNSTFNFTNNSASYEGGAIYYYSIDKHDYDYSYSCFIQTNETKSVLERNVNFFFSGNRAGVGNHLSEFGHSIYASSLRPCVRQFSEDNKCRESDVFKCIGNFNYSGTNRSFEISTEINAFSIDRKAADQHILSFIPGKLQEMPFRMLDEFQQVENAALRISISAKDNSVTTNFFYTSNNAITLFGYPGENVTVSLTTTDSHVLKLSFESQMQPCPPGFILGNKSDSSSMSFMSCICSAYTPKMYYGIQKCNSSTFTAFRSRGYWVGYSRLQRENESTLLSGFCPSGFCNLKHQSLLPAVASRSLLSSAVCADKREGVLCGHCCTNYSAYYHSTTYRCGPNEKCHYGWIFYILSEIIPVTLFFMFVIFFSLSFTSGLAYGFVFFAQVIEFLQITGGQSIGFPKAVYILNKIHQTLYYVFNLRFFIFKELSYCLIRNASALDMIAFNYVSLIYAFMLVLLLIFIMKNRKIWLLLHRLFKVRIRTTKGTIIHGISTFLVVCYSQCAQTSLLLLSSARLWGQGGSTHSIVSKYNGELESFSLPNMKYAIPAIVFLIVIVIIPPLLLLAYPLCYKIFSCLSISESRGITILCKVIPLERLKPFFDSFQSCFKDEYRFFSGLYFIYRLTLLINMALYHYRNFYLVVELQLIGTLIIHSICQPYKERVHNVIDILLLGNLALINGLTMYNFFTIESASDGESIVRITGWIQAVLIFLPLVCGSLYLILTQPAIKRTIRKIFLCKKTVRESNSTFFDDEIPSRSLSLSLNMNPPYHNFQ